MSKLIGIIGGLGPEAGLDLHRKILSETPNATCDGDHLEVILHTNPRVPDRTQFILGKESSNPAHEIIRSARILVDAGAELLAVACVTAHCEPIFAHLRECVAMHPGVRLVSIVDAAARAGPVGLLATSGTASQSLFNRALAAIGRNLLLPDHRAQETVHEAIYNLQYGIKSSLHAESGIARKILFRAARSLVRRGAAVILLGCTEIPLVITEDRLDGVQIIDPVLELARWLAAMARGVQPLHPAQPAYLRRAA
jgi:aspartate racemase